MPELPEVETIRRGLENKIIGLTISDIQILNPKSFHGDSKSLIGAKVEKVFRRAKMLGIVLDSLSLVNSLKKQNPNKKRDSKKTILFHLKMSGQIILALESGRQKADSENKFVGGHPTKDMLGELPNRSTRIIFTLKESDESKVFKLYFNDQRKFGWVKVIQNSELRIQKEKLFEKLGPEPLEEEFTWQVLKDQLQKRKNTPIKVALLDQQVVSGVGNIYASEACFIAKIDPQRRVGTLSDPDIKKLHQAIIQTLSDGIKYGGSTRTHFVNESGKKGLFLDYAYVYSRENSACKNCQTILLKIKLGGRGTVYCPKCQI